MKGLKALAAVLVATGLLASAAPVSALAAPADPPAEGGGAYQHYVACGISRNATPSHVCPKGSKKGAFFKSLNAEVKYTVCVRFPSGKNLCAKAQPAEQGTLYVNKITSTIPGKHRVTWFVEGKRVGSFIFRVKG